MAMSCPRCSGQILDSQRFCRFCGYRLDQGVQDYTNTMVFEPAGRTQAPPQDFAQPPAPWRQTSCAPPAPPIRRKTFRRRMIAALFVFLVLATAGKIVENGIQKGWFSDKIVRIARTEVATASAYLGVHFEDSEMPGAFIDGLSREDVPAAGAGLIGGDLVVQADDTPIQSRGEMMKFLASKAPGDQIRLKYIRDGQLMETLLVVGSKEDFEADEVRVGPRAFFGIDGDGVRVRVPGRQIYGMRLDSLVKNGPADLAGIRRGDIVLEFDGHPLRTQRELSRRIRRAEARSVVPLKVFRDGEELVIPVKLGER